MASIHKDFPIDAPAHDLLRQPPIIARRIVTEQRKMETVFARRCSVAASAVASSPEKHRHHVQTKANRARGLHRRRRAVRLFGIRLASRSGLRHARRQRRRGECEYDLQADFHRAAVTFRAGSTRRTPEPVCCLMD